MPESKNESPALGSEFVYGAVSDKQIADWKKAHGEVYSVRFIDEKKQPFVGYFRSLSRDEFSYLMTLENSRFEQCSELARQTYLGGDERITSDWRHLFSAGQTLLEANQMPTGGLEKL